MRNSMRRETVIIKKRAERDATRTMNRQEALRMLQAGLPKTNIASDTGVCHETVISMKKAMGKEDKTDVNKLMNSASNHAGARPVLRKNEEEMIAARAVQAAERGFAMTVRDVETAVAEIASDGRARSYQRTNGLPSKDVIRRFRAGNRNLTYRNRENKDKAKLRGEEYSHVRTYEVALRTVEKETPGIFKNPSVLYNMDETSVDSEFGTKIKVFGPSNTNHGGFNASSTNGKGKHVTAVISCSAEGQKPPPFFIVAGGL